MRATELVLDALATYRLTKLVTDDSLLDGPRDAVVRWSFIRSWRGPLDDPLQRTLRWEGQPVDTTPEPGEWADYARADPTAPKLATLLTCRWCAGMWVALGVVVARAAAPKAWAPLARALAFSAVAGLGVRLEDG